jgi:hypothetical protein
MRPSRYRFAVQNESVMPIIKPMACATLHSAGSVFLKDADCDKRNNGSSTQF